MKFLRIFGISFLSLLGMALLYLFFLQIKYLVCPHSVTFKEKGMLFANDSAAWSN